MSRQATLERIVSARVGSNMYQGCVINPYTGMSSVPKGEVSDNGSIIDEESDNNEKSSTEDNADIVIGGPKQVIDSDETAVEYDQFIRPEERRSNRNHGPVTDSKVPDRVDDLQEKKSSTEKEKINHEIKPKKRKTGKKVLKSKKDKNPKKKQDDKSNFDDNDEVVAGHQHLISEMKSMNGDQIFKYKSLLGELDTFRKVHESVLADRGEKLNLEPSNVNMDEFNYWLDNAEKGTLENNDSKYKTYTVFCNSKKPTKLKQKKKKTNKQTEISTIPANLEYDNCLPKHAWYGEMDDASSQISYEEPVEILDETVLNSWRSMPVLNKKKETKIIRVTADKKHIVNDSTDILLDVE